MFFRVMCFFFLSLKFFFSFVSSFGLICLLCLVKWWVYSRNSGVGILFFDLVLKSLNMLCIIVMKFFVVYVSRSKMNFLGFIRFEGKLVSLKMLLMVVVWILIFVVIFVRGIWLMYFSFLVCWYNLMSCFMVGGGVVMFSLIMVRRFWKYFSVNFFRFFGCVCMVFLVNVLSSVGNLLGILICFI